ATLGPLSAASRDTGRAERAFGSAASEPSEQLGQSAGSSRAEPRPRTPWAELLRRTFEIDVLACPDCGGRLRLLATIEEPAVVRRILSHLGVPSECQQPLPARSPPSAPDSFDFRHA